MYSTFLRLVERHGSDPRVHLFGYGLAGNTGQLPLYGSNAQLEASIYRTKNDVDNTVVTVCDFVEASRFFTTYIAAHDDVYLKLNCEGAEVPILDNLCFTGEINKVSHLMVDFDIAKVVGFEKEEGRIRERLAGVGMNYTTPPDIGVFHSHQDFIAAWLEGEGL
jgi:hypothetical protein